MLNKKLLAVFLLSFIAILHHSCNNQTENKAENKTVAETGTHPAWAAQSNIYEVNLRQFSAAGTITAFERVCGLREPSQ